MATPRANFGLSAAASLILSVALSAQGARPPARRLALPSEGQIDAARKNEAFKKEMEAVTKAVDDAVAGRPMPNELGLTWLHQDVLKAQGNKQFLPFIVSVDPSKVSGGKLTFYWGVVSKDAMAAAAAAPPPDAKKDAKSQPAGPEFAYEDLNQVNVAPGQTTPMRIARSFTASPGTYDVIILAKESTPDKVAKNAPPLKVSVIKQTLTVPDFWNDELNTSSVIVAERIDPLPVAPTPQQQLERPYAMGAMEIIPATSTKFTKKSELSTLVLIYNAKTDAANKPDVSVEYSFFAKEAGAEKFFNKTNPQSLNAQTLPPEFDFAMGHQLQSGQAVPLASFPEGEYRLEIKIVDKIANKTVTRDVNFSVSGT